MAENDITIRSARPEDIPAINAIHKHYVENTVLTFTLEPNTDETALENFKDINEEGLPYLVACSNSTTKMLGYAYVTTFRGVKKGYLHSLELSLFCDPGEVRKGIGQQLLNQMVDIVRRPEDYRDWFRGTRLLDCKPMTLIACMAVDEDMPGQGWKLRDWYMGFGFEQTGYLRQVGWKKERWVDTLFLQLMLSR